MSILPGGGKKGSSGKKRGLIGKITEPGKDIVGAAANLLGAPQQVVFKAGQGIGDIATGHAGAGFKSLLGAAGEAATLGQAGGNIGFSEAAGQYDEKTGKHVAAKLPKGLETAANIVLDPLLFTAVGKGAEARKGIKVLEGLGMTDVSKAIKTGALDLSKGSAGRRVLEQELVAGGSKAKQAAKIGKLTARRGAGGINAFIPGTEISKNIVGGEKLASGASKLAAVGKAVPGGEAIAEGAKQALKPGYSLAKGIGEDLSKTVRNMGAARQTKAATVADDLLHEISNAVHAVGRKLDPSDDAEILNAMESGTAEVAALAGRKPELAPLLAVVERTREATTKSQQIAGVLEKTHKGDTYMQRLLTPEASKVAKGGTAKAQAVLASDVAGSVESALKQSATKGRSIFPDMPVQQINELKDAVDNGVPVRQLLNDPAYAKYVKGVDPAQLDVAAKDFEGLAQELPKGAKFYQETALGSLLNRSASAQRAVQASHYVNDLRGLKSATGDALVLDEASIAARHAAGQALPHGYVVEELPHIGKIAAPAELLKEMKNVTGKIASDDFMAQFEKGMGAWQKFWKTHATTGMLGALPFAMRNARSNIYLMITDGMTPGDVGRYMKEAKQLEDKVRTVLGSSRLTGKFIGEHSNAVATHGLDDILRTELTGHEYDLWRAMQKEGITTRGFFDIDFSDDLGAKVRKLTGQKATEGNKATRLAKAVISPEGTVARKGRDLNQAVETNARMASFLYNMDKYGNVAEAAQATKKVLFDYSELTEFEMRVMKNIVPFYTFMRKNLPHQLETLLKNPTRIVLPENLSEATASGLGEDAPDYQKDQGARTINALLPLFGGAVSTPDRPFHAAADVLSPLTLAAQGRGMEAARAAANVPGGPQLAALNSLAEVGTGKSLFTGAGVEPGLRAGIQNIVTGQVPSLGRLPRVEAKGVSPTRVLTGKKAKPTVDELLKLLTGLRVDRPRS